MLVNIVNMSPSEMFKRRGRVDRRGGAMMRYSMLGRGVIRVVCDTRNDMGLQAQWRG